LKWKLRIEREGAVPPPVFLQNSADVVEKKELALHSCSAKVQKSDEESGVVR
jgi:hypothetical protein